MSFDLYVFDRDDLPDDEEAIGQLLEDDKRWGRPLTPRLAALVAELERRYPGLDDEPDASPWASWPLTDSMADGTGVGLNIVWSQSERMSTEVRLLAEQHGLTVYDPQASAVIRSTGPTGEQSPTKPKRWWKRS
jgi:hypothetical protein